MAEVQTEATLHAEDMSDDPTFGCHPGRDILPGSTFNTCRKCGNSVMSGQIKDVHGKLQWRRWDAIPVEHEGQRYYRPHRCE